MNEIGRIVHAYQSMKAHNEHVQSIETCIAYLSDHDWEGNLLNADLAMLKSNVTQVCESLSMRTQKLTQFVSTHDAYETAGYIEIPTTQLVAAASAAGNFASRLSSEVVVARINTKGRLAELASSFTNPLDYINHKPLSREHHNAIMLNDWVDAAYYTLNDIHQHTGVTLGWTALRCKELARKYLLQIYSLPAAGYPVDVSDEVSTVLEAAEWTLDNLNSSSIEELTTYLGTIPKLPLLRRMWAVG